MRWITLGFAATLLSGAAALVQAADEGTELQRLQDRWIVPHRYYTPSAATDPLAKLLTDLGNDVEIKNGKLSAREPDKEGRHLLIEFDSSTEPKNVNLRIPDQEDQVLLGIYKLEDDILSLAVGTGTRPTEFSNSETQVLLILTRAPKMVPPSDEPDSP